MLNQPKVVRALGAVVLAAFVVAFVLSAIHGHTQSLPAMALDWPVLLYLERAALATALVLVLIVAVVHLVRGQLPSKLSTGGVEWADAAGLPGRDVLEALVDATTEIKSALQQIAGTSPEVAEKAADQLERADKAVRDARDRERVANAIISLPEREKLAIALTHYEGLSTEEVAQALGVSKTAVRTLLRRAAADITRNLGNDDNDDPPVSPVSVV